jgi:ribosomal-protein-alanine N-acetyltransferase
MNYDSLAYFVESMRLEDLEEVIAIERLSFPTPWPSSAYRYELCENSRAHYFVARPRVQVEDIEEEVEAPSRGLLQRILSRPPKSSKGKPPVVGYGGFWCAGGEAHISNIAVHPEFRRQGIGSLLLTAMIEGAAKLGADYMTLEVRVSNRGAQLLYEKYGFKAVGRRLRYYSDNQEDALIMAIENLTLASSDDQFERLRRSPGEQLRQ